MRAWVFPACFHQKFRLVHWKKKIRLVPEIQGRVARASEWGRRREGEGEGEGEGEQEGAQEGEQEGAGWREGEKESHGLALCINILVGNNLTNGISRITGDCFRLLLSGSQITTIERERASDYYYRERESFRLLLSGSKPWYSRAKGLGLKSRMRPELGVSI
jgi:hypothetical protein